MNDQNSDSLVDFEKSAFLLKTKGNWCRRALTSDRASTLVVPVHSRETPTQS